MRLPSDMVWLPEIVLENKLRGTFPALLASPASLPYAPQPGPPALPAYLPFLPSLVLAGQGTQ